MLFIFANGGWYPIEAKADYEQAGTWPSNGVEVSQEVYDSLAGKHVVADSEGFPVEYIAPPKTLDQLKGEKNIEINEARLAANGTIFVHQGHPVSCDQLSRSDIDGQANHIALFGAFTPDFPGVWKTDDNQYIPMADIESFKAMYQSMTAAGTANFNRSQSLKTALANAETAEEISQIVW